MTGLTGVYVAWTAFVMSRRVPVFETLFSGLGAELPLLSRVIVTIGKPLVIWSGAVVILAVLVVNEIRCEDFRTRLVISILVFIATACVSSIVIEALFQPMMQLIKQVG